MTDQVVLEVEYIVGQDVTDSNFTLTANVIRNEYVDPHIFVYQRALDDVDTFVAVATPVRLDEFPVDAPQDGKPFFRTDTVELEFESLLLLNQALANFRADINSLVDDQQTLLNEYLNTTFTEVYEGDVDD